MRPYSFIADGQGPTSLQDQQLSGPGISWLTRVIPCIHRGRSSLLIKIERHHAEGRVERSYVEPHRRRRMGPISISFVQLLLKFTNDRYFHRWTPSPNKTNLPGNTQPFSVENELQQLSNFDEGARLIVLKGPGGIGKTRLATRFANLHIEDYSSNGDGVWICDCTESRSISGVVHALASVLNVPLTVRGLQATNQLGNALASRGRILIILDNFDHATEYAQLTIGQWLSKARDAHFIVTSRARLDVTGARHIEVAALSQHESVALFREGARRAGADRWSEDVQGLSPS